MPYKKEGTIVEEMQNKLFEKLVDYDIPILFVNTHNPYNPDEIVHNSYTNKTREMRRKTIENAIKSLIKNIFQKKDKLNNADTFINNYIYFYYVNLVRDYDGDLPPFGNKLLSFFTKSVPKEDWRKFSKKLFQK